MDTDPQTANILFQITILLILTLINAFFAGSEMAVVSVNKGKIHRLAESGNKNAALIERLMEDSTVFLSTIQVAITLAGFFSSASAATGIAQVLAGKMAEWNIPYSQSLAGVVVTIILAYFNLVFGELVPKRIALQKAEWFRLFLSLINISFTGTFPPSAGGTFFCARRSGFFARWEALRP